MATIALEYTGTVGRQFPGAHGKSYLFQRRGDRARIPQEDALKLLASGQFRIVP